MIDDAFQKAVYAVLVAANVTGGRIYDEPPADAEFPYTVIGDDQVLDDGTDCQDGWEVFLDVHIWSRPATGSFLEAKAEGKVVVGAIRGMSTIEGYTLSHIEHVQSLTRRDPEGDGKTRQLICQFRALVDPATT